jgi:hypothetical protein
MTDKKKNSISKTLEKTLEDIQTSVTTVVGKFDEIKDMIQKNVNDNLDKIKGLSQNTQELGKKYVDSVLTHIPFKDFLDKVKSNDYKELANGIKSELENKFNVGIDQILNAFSISSTLDNKELVQRIEVLEKEIKALKKPKKEVVKKETAEKKETKKKPSKVKKEENK